MQECKHRYDHVGEEKTTQHCALRCGQEDDRCFNLEYVQYCREEDKLREEKNENGDL